MLNQVKIELHEPPTMYLREAWLTRNPTFSYFYLRVGDGMWLRKSRSITNTHCKQRTMNNTKVLQLLEQQRDGLFVKLRATSISKLYQDEYDELKSGRVISFDSDEREMLKELKELARDTSFDEPYRKKLDEYEGLDNAALVRYFEVEIIRVIDEIFMSERQDEIQALFIEYDYYYHFTSYVTCYGKQEYPLIEEPRCISDEIDFEKEILFIDNGVNFRPAWIDCLAFGDLDYLDINFELEKLFQLHSRTLLFRSLKNLDSTGILDNFKRRPFTFYINEHDSEVMTLYRLI